MAIGLYRLATSLHNEFVGQSLLSNKTTGSNERWLSRIQHAIVGSLARNRTIGWIMLFVPIVIVFYWKILLTDQFSLLTNEEGVNQAYSWLRYWISSVRHGVLPIWDPNTFGGHSFCGEMQTAVFYPLHLLLVLFPLNHAT